MKHEVLHLTHEGVTLETYVLDPSPEMKHMDFRPAVLVFPGGAYAFCSDREAEPIASKFLAMGFSAFVLRYSLGKNADFPTPLEDAEEALNLMMNRAAEWHIDSKKIAVCGFSAGGHLAAALGTLGKVKPAALILGYPCITKELCDSDVLVAKVPPLDERVDSSTPPTFLFATANDDLVPVSNSLAFASALDKNGVSFELHIFSDGPHGLATADYVTNGFTHLDEDGTGTWLRLCRAWLFRQFFLKGIDKCDESK